MSKHTPQELMNLLLNLKNLPSFSQVAMMLIQTLNEDEPDTNKINKIIMDDPSIASSVLKLANSAMYGGLRTIDTIQDALVRIGLKQTRRLAIFFAMINYLKKMPVSHFRTVEFWEHSIGVAICTEEIQKASGIFNCKESYAHVIGLLHDIGRLITASYLPEVHQHFDDDSPEIDTSGKVTFWEREVIGLDHAQIGAEVLEHWRLPQPIVNCVRFHHEPGNCPKEQQEMAYLLHLSDCICRKIGIGDVGEGPVGKIEGYLWKVVGISSDMEQKIVESVQKQVKESEVSLIIAGNGA